MSAIYFTVVGIALYFVSDWLLQLVEAQAGRRFEYRTVLFFVILLTLALIAFSLIQRLTGVSQ